jgi:hypothetical protein
VKGSVTVTCKVCGEVISVEELPLAGHKYESVVTKPTTTTQGYTTHTCTVCGDSYVDSYVKPIVLPSGNATLKLSGANLRLESDLTLNIKVKEAVFAAGAYTNFRLEVYMIDAKSGEKRTVVFDETSEYNFDGTARIYTFDGISPRKMNDTIYLDLYGTYEGQEYVQSMTYSIASYCYNQLNKSTNSAKFFTLLADLLNFGAAHQVYGSYNTENMVNAGLTDAHKAYVSTYALAPKTVTNINYVVNPNATAAFKGAGLTLTSKVEIKYTVETTDLTDISLHLSYVDDKGVRHDDVLDASCFVPKTGKVNQYEVSYDGLMAKQMSTAVEATVYRGETAISNTALYSIESYIASNINKATSSDALKNLLKMMMYYGNSAAAYFS